MNSWLDAPPARAPGVPRPETDPKPPFKRHEWDGMACFGMNGSEPDLQEPGTNNPTNPGPGNGYRLREPYKPPMTGRSRILHHADSQPYPGRGRVSRGPGERRGSGGKQHRPRRRGLTLEKAVGSAGCTEYTDGQEPGFGWRDTCQARIQAVGEPPFPPGPSVKSVATATARLRVRRFREPDATCARRSSRGRKPDSSG